MDVDQVSLERVGDGALLLFETNGGKGVSRVRPAVDKFRGGCLGKWRDLRLRPLKED